MTPARRPRPSPAPIRRGPAPSLPESQPAGVQPAETQPVATAAEPVQAAEAEPAEPEKSVEELLAELDALTGLADVKAEIHRQVAVLRVERMRVKAGLRSATITRHLVFVGNPGTGQDDRRATGRRDLRARWGC